MLSAVPIFSVQPASELPSEQLNAFLENPADPASRLTQAAMKAVNAIFKSKRTSDLLPTAKIGVSPLFKGNCSPLLPGNWLDDEAMNA